MPLAIALPATLLAFVSGYGLTLSYETVTRLRAYESQSEKAAEWSRTAAERLHRTRTTQTGAAISLCLSFLTSLSLFAVPQYRLYTALGNVVWMSASRVHMQRFWNRRTQVRIPFVEKFNEAVRGSEELVTVQQLLALGWLVVGVVWWVTGV